MTVLKEIVKKFEIRLIKIEKEIYQISGKEFNIGSPKQLGEIIYNDLKIAKLKKTKKGSLATSAKILEDLALTGHKFPNLVLEWRQVSKLKSTYTDALQDHINEKTKEFIHLFFLQLLTLVDWHQVIQIYKIYLLKPLMAKRLEKLYC